MKRLDKKLGMDRSITRRDFVHGAGALGAAAVLAGSLSGCAEVADQKPSPYPPSYTGMRGNHDSSFQVAHAIGREGKTDWGPVQDVDDLYDLVIVGAGISGLAAAHFYQQEEPNARILILDNHDDFGGHAKRNEVEVNGRILLAEGGSLELSEPHGYSDLVKNFLFELGIDFDRLENIYDNEFNRKHGLSRWYHFNKDVWGKSVMVPSGGLSKWGRTSTTNLTLEETIERFPISEKAKEELLYLYTIEEDQIPHLSQEEKIAYLSKLSYQDFLTQHIGITEQDVFDFLQDQTGDMGLGIGSTDTYMGMIYGRVPGWAATGLIREEEDRGGRHKFPDGNASLTRLMVRALIPGVAPGNTMEDVVMARFDYGKLDQANSNVRIRLNSTVINVMNNEDAKGVTLTYVRDNKASLIKAKKCVLACNNAMIPYLCPELPEEQKAALANQVRQPILSTCVVVKNWHAWKKIGMSSVSTPGAYFTGVRLQTPLSIGGYTSPQEPDQPMMLKMTKYPHVKNGGLTAQEQYRAGRHELLSTSFEEMERHIRAQLNELLGDAGFNAAEDIEAIIVNRWAHGYAYSYGFHNLFEDDYEDPNDERYLHVTARKQKGRITIANSDAGASAMLETAIEQAHRAVGELREV